MKNMKKLMAALLVLSMITALCGTAFAAKFTPRQAAEGLFVEFTGSAYGYNSPRNSSRSDTIVKKGSVGLLVGLKGDKWCKVVVTDGTMNAMGQSKELWFGEKYLKKVKDQDYAYIRCIFSSGGNGLSVQEYTTSLEALKGKKIITSGKVNIRPYACLQGNSVGVVKKGKILTCTGVLGYDSRYVFFFQVKYNGKKRFVSAEFIKDWADIVVEALAQEGI